MLTDLVHTGMVLKEKDANGEILYSLTGQGITEVLPVVLEKLPRILCDGVQALIGNVLESASLLANISGQWFPTPFWKQAAQQEVFFPKDQMICHLTPKGERIFGRIHGELSGIISDSVSSSALSAMQVARSEAAMLDQPFPAPGWEGVIQNAGLLIDLAKKRVAWDAINAALYDLYDTLKPLADLTSARERVRQAFPLMNNSVHFAFPDRLIHPELPDDA